MSIGRYWMLLFNSQLSSVTLSFLVFASFTFEWDITVLSLHVQSTMTWYSFSSISIWFSTTSQVTSSAASMIGTARQATTSRRNLCEESSVFDETEAVSYLIILKFTQQKTKQNWFWAKKTLFRFHVNVLFRNIMSGESWLIRNNCKNIEMWEKQSDCSFREIQTACWKLQYLQQLQLSSSFNKINSFQVIHLIEATPQTSPSFNSTIHNQPQPTWITINGINNKHPRPFARSHSTSLTIP
jgi:hypothetical protein